MSGRRLAPLAGLFLILTWGALAARDAAAAQGAGPGQDLRSPPVSSAARDTSGGKDAPTRQAEAGATLSAAELDGLAARVASQLRCPVCRNQSVLESSAELAREMQRVIRERLASGESPEQVKAYFVSRYGSWILLKPEPRGVNLLVYVAPALAFLLGGGLVARQLRRWAGGRKASPDAAPLESGGAVTPGPAAQSATGDGSVAADAPASHSGRITEPRSPRATTRRSSSGAEKAGASTGLSAEEEAWLDRAIRED